MNNADIGWMLISTALVLLMTPALALFYGPSDRRTRSTPRVISFVAGAFPPR